MTDMSRDEMYTLENGELGFSLNVASMKFTDAELDFLSGKFVNAHEEMVKLEAGAIKNPDENRKVTHFTDRMSYPNETLFLDVEAFAEAIKDGNILGSTGKKINYVVVNGIGGSALGPQLMQFAVNGAYWNEQSEEKRKSYPQIYFIDNTDSAGIEDVLAVVDLEETLIVNISKSGGTQETKNNIIAFELAFERAALEFVRHACAITMVGSQLDKKSKSEGWLKVFPMAESIGGRTSETSIVGHLPAAMTGIDFKAFLSGACKMDEWTRGADFKKNPSYLLAAMWYLAGEGKGNKNMVVVPYSDRLVLFSKYMQQLVMESLGKEKGLDGNIVHQGLSVFGNKGGTDAHAFMQQLNDGRDDFFVTFIEVLRDSAIIPIKQGITMGDYLHAFQKGLTDALTSKGRQVIQIQIDNLDASTLGMMIALYERAVAVYGELININSFNQPGVEAYKLASNRVVQLISDLEVALASLGSWSGTAKELFEKVELGENVTEVDGILAKFAVNNDIRNFDGFSISRQWGSAKGWIYNINKK